MTSLRDALNAVLQRDNVIDFQQMAATVGQTPAHRAVECATCNDTGFLVSGRFNPADNHYSETTTRCPNPACPTVRANLRQRYDRLVAKAPLPPEYRDFDLKDWYRLAEREPDKMAGKWLGLGAAMVFVQTTADGHWFRLQDAYAMVNAATTAPNEHRKNSLVLAGRPGVGKTSLAACIVNGLREQDVPALYMRVADMLDALREPMNRHDEDYMYEFGRTEQQILRTFQQAPVMVMDEFNLARASDYSRQRLEDMVRYRMMHQLPTVMTTNLNSFDEFNDHWGYRVGHAVQGMAHWIVLSGAELRRRGQAVESV